MVANAAFVLPSPRRVPNNSGVYPGCGPTPSATDATRTIWILLCSDWLPQLPAPPLPRSAVGVAVRREFARGCWRPPLLPAGRCPPTKPGRSRPLRPPKPRKPKRTLALKPKRTLPPKPKRTPPRTLAVAPSRRRQRREPRPPPRPPKSPAQKPARQNRRAANQPGPLSRAAPAKSRAN